MKNETRLNIRISTDLLERFKNVADKKQMSISTLTRLLILNLVEDYESGNNRNFWNNSNK